MQVITEVRSWSDPDRPGSATVFWATCRNCGGRNVSPRDRKTEKAAFVDASEHGRTSHNA